MTGETFEINAHLTRGTLSVLRLTPSRTELRVQQAAFILKGSYAKKLDGN